jgi:hypothetical protein
MARKTKDDQPTTIAAPDAGDVKLSAHPRARAQIRRAKGVGGLIGFFLVAYVSWHHGTDFVHLGLRAILGGMAFYVVSWAAAVYYWRQLAIAEVRQRARIVAARQIAAEDARAARNQA